jgi:hypothetical protein
MGDRKASQVLGEIDAQDTAPEISASQVSAEIDAQDATPEISASQVLAEIDAQKQNPTIYATQILVEIDVEEIVMVWPDCPSPQTNLSVAPSTYLIEIQNPYGVKVAQINYNLTLRYSFGINKISSLFMELPSTVDRSLFQIDGRVLIYRNGVLEGNTVWLIRYPGLTMRENGSIIFGLYAYSANELLQRRIVAYFATSSYSEKSDFADDMMKSIVRENFGALATDADRDISAYLSIEADLSLGPSMGKAFSWRNVFDVLSDIADVSAEKGTNLFFNVVLGLSGNFEFRTYVGQLGADRRSTSASPLILSPGLGSISYGSVWDDYRDEVNAVYAGGDGERELRLVAEETDDARIGKSPINRREAFWDARNGVSLVTLSDDAKEKLFEGRARRRFGGTIANTWQTQYGRDWFFGDAVNVQFEGGSYDCLIRSVAVDVTEGKETISARAESELII